MSAEGGSRQRYFPLFLLAFGTALLLWPASIWLSLFLAGPPLLFPLIYFRFQVISASIQHFMFALWVVFDAFSLFPQVIFLFLALFLLHFKQNSVPTFVICGFVLDFHWGLRFFGFWFSVYGVSGFPFALLLGF